MKLKHLMLATMFAFTASASLMAQNFTSPYDRFSSEKVCYFTLTDGKKVEGKIDKVKRTKGLIEQIIIQKDGSKEKTTLTGEQIQFMYLYPSGFDKLATINDKITTLNRWKEGEGVDDKLIKEGYAYFEATNVKLKKGTKKLLMQLLNPSFCEKIKVFHNPLANETGGLAVGGLQVTGGEDKSFYVKVGNDDAFLLAKKDYRDNFLNIFKDCKDFTSKNPKPMWTDFDKHIYEYTKDCTK